MEKLLGDTSVKLLMLAVLVCLAPVEAMVRYSIMESLPPQSMIGNLPRDADLDLMRTDEELAMLTYSFLNQPGTDSDYFTVDEHTGLLRTATVIDRDVMCLHQSTCTLTMDVATGPAEFFSVINIEVDVNDINDNPPTFTEDFVEVSVSELSLPGASFALPIALDLDYGSNGLASYSLQEGSEDFELAQNIEEGELSLILRRPLDREKQSFYQLTVLAFDGGDPMLTGSLAVDVTVGDANDNSPRFVNQSYTAFINEDMPVNQTLIRVHAVDADIGEYGRIRYSFASQTQLIYGHLFGIRPSSGEVYLRQMIQYNNNNNAYELTVNARDSGPGSQPARATVNIHVSDVNNNAPQITVNTLTADGRPQVPEHTGPGEFVAHISVSDLDGGVNGQVNCSLQGYGFALEHLPQGQYKVITTAVFDREVHGQYTVTITCQDLGSPSLSTAHVMTVHILDINDHTPTFPRAQYYTSVAENNDIGKVVLQVNASDLDIGENGYIHYSIIGDHDGYFSIESPEGIIRAERLLDYEFVSVLDFRVIAEDGGNPPRSSSCAVTVTVMDQNDNAPSFVTEQYAFSVMENLPSGTAVGTVHAQDLDRSPYDEIEYGLAPYGSVDEFMINSATGEIWTLRSLDRELSAQHYLIATATNPGYPSLTTTVSTIISVTDENDNSPVVKFPPSGQNTSVLVYNDVPLGFMVTQILAEDPDTGHNAELSFQIEEGNIDNIFLIDEGSGIITVNNDLEDLELRRYYLRILILDNGVPQRISWTGLTIDVNQSLVLDNSFVGGLLTGTNKTIVISLATASTFIVIVLIASILIIKTYDRRNRNKNGQNQVRIEIQKMLGANSDKESSEGQASPSHGHCSLDSGQHKDTTANCRPENVASNTKAVNTSAVLPKVNNQNGKAPYGAPYQTAILPQVHFSERTQNGPRKTSFADRPCDHQIAEYHHMNENSGTLKRNASDSVRDKPPNNISKASSLRSAGSLDRCREPTLPPRSSSLSNAMDGPHRPPDHSRQPPHMAQRQNFPAHLRRQPPPPPPPPPSSFRPHQPSAAYRHPPSSHPTRHRVTPAGGTACGPGRHYAPIQHPSTSHPHTLDVYPVSEGELEIHRILQMLEREDAESTFSGDGSNTSNTDSGKGPSEEGDGTGASQLDSSAEHIMRQKLSRYLRHLEPGSAAACAEGLHGKQLRDQEFPSPSESDDYQALLQRLGISAKYPPASQKTAYGSRYNCHDNPAADPHDDEGLTGRDAATPNCSSHVPESHQSEPYPGSHDLQSVFSLASCDGQSSVNDLADDATTTSGSYVVDLDDVKSELDETEENDTTV